MVERIENGFERHSFSSQWHQSNSIDTRKVSIFVGGVYLVRSYEKFGVANIFRNAGTRINSSQLAEIRSARVS